MLGGTEARFYCRTPLQSKQSYVQTFTMRVYQGFGTLGRDPTSAALPSRRQSRLAPHWEFGNHRKQIEHICADIETIGFNVNPYDPCVANRIIEGSQHTVPTTRGDRKLNPPSMQHPHWKEQSFLEFVFLPW